MDSESIYRGVLVELTQQALAGGEDADAISRGGVADDVTGMDLLGDLGDLGGGGGGEDGDGEGDAPGSSSSSSSARSVDVMWRGDVSDREFAPLSMEVIELEAGGDGEDGQGTNGGGGIRRQQWPSYGLSFHQCAGLQEGEALCLRLGHMHGRGSARDPMGSSLGAAKDRAREQVRRRQMAAAAAKQSVATAARAQSQRERAIGASLQGYWRLAAAQVQSEARDRILGAGGAVGGGVPSSRVQIEGWELRRPRKPGPGPGPGPVGARGGKGAETRPDGTVSTASVTSAAVRFAPRAVVRR